MTPEGANRILSAVGRACYPEGIDRSAMIRGLELCAKWHREASRYSTDKVERDQRARLGQITKAAKKLKLLLQTHDQHKLYDWESTIVTLARRGVDVFQTLDRLIDQVEADLHSRETDEARESYSKSFQERSAIEWLVGFWLPELYMELRFLDPGSKEAFLAADSPFIRFTVAILDELDIRNGDQPYSRITVVKAAALPFSRGSRRKKGTALNDYHWWRVQLLRKAVNPHLFPDDDSLPS